MAKILVFDLGTTYFKAALFDRAGRLGRAARLAPPLARAADGRLELDPDAFLATLVDATRRLASDVPDGLADVEALSFATQTNSFVLLDAAGSALGPIILWPDARAAGLEDEVRRRCAMPGFTGATGVPGVGAQFMIAKLLWLRQRRPDIWQRAARLCLVSDYLTLLLTGRHVTEAGAAGLTGLLDIHDARWWEPVLGAFDLDRRLLAEPVRAGTDLGPIVPQAAERFSLPGACRFVVGCLDQYAGAIGSGNVRPGMVSETTGTVLATVRCADRFQPDPSPEVFQGPGWRQGLYWRMAFGSVSANYLEWYRGQLPDRPGFDELCALAAAVPPGADGLRLRPEAGLTTPGEVFAGLAPRHARGHAVRAILEAVAEALRGQVRALCGDAPPAIIRCAGGAARSRLWLRIKADTLGVPVATVECDEPTALGAAALAESALGDRPVEEIAREWVRLREPIGPSADATRTMS